MVDTCALEDSHSGWPAIKAKKFPRRKIRREGPGGKAHNQEEEEHESKLLTG